MGRKRNSPETPGTNDLRARKPEGKIIADMSVTPPMYDAQQVPDFIEGPAHIIDTGRRRPTYFTILGRNIHKDGELDLKQFPILGVSYYAALDFKRALDALLPSLPSVVEHGLEEKMERISMRQGPRVRATNTIATYTQWLEKNSVTQLGESLKGIEGLSAADAAQVQALWKQEMPGMKQAAIRFAGYLAASENHLPRYEDITFTR